MIRLSLEAETDQLVELTRHTGVFKPLEIQALVEVLDDFYTEPKDHRCITFEDDGRPVGFAYYAPAAMTDHTWYLYWIAVDPAAQRSGIGSALLAYAEDDIRTQKGRLLLVETSSMPHYEPTRRFYLKHGYQQGATIEGYYAAGDDMIVFRKLLNA